MGRIEFIEILQKALAGSLGSSLVNSNIRYYQDYIDMEIRKGKSEEDVIKDLGDPRLLAKTIIEAGKHEGRTLRPEYDEVYEEGAEEGPQESYGGKVYRMPGWMLILLIVVLFVVVIGIVGSVLSMLLPIIIPVLCIVFIVRFFQRRG